ncbi:MAG: mechanosensitive ion channel family protein [Gemmatimonadota bacterium]|nr:mechanosensitive ion channel family protein [Gemmatimonadota bacterium]
MKIDLGIIWISLQHIATSALAALPRLVLGAAFFLVFFFVARVTRRVIRRAANRKGETRTLEIAIGRIAEVLIVAFGMLVALTVALPSFTAAGLISALGVGGVAIGFAFKDIFQNFLAGLLILITKPFRVGDQISFKEFEGSVEDIQTRATYVKTYDGRRVIIPNSELFTNSVTVNTSFPRRRSQYDIGIGYGDDIDKARGIILRVLMDAEGVDPDPHADVIVVQLGDSTVTLRARWWSDSRMVDVLNAQDRVLTSIKNELTAAGIDLPFPTRQILLHDQTEKSDGDRATQREGWPKPPDASKNLGRSDRFVPTQPAPSDKARDTLIG